MSNIEVNHTIKDKKNTNETIFFYNCIDDYTCMLTR